MSPHQEGNRAGSALKAGLLLALVAFAGAVALYGLRLASDYEVLEKGRLLAYTRGLVYKIRFGGWLTVYIEPELRPTIDLLNGYLMTGVGFIALTFATIRAKVFSDRSSSRLGAAAGQATRRRADPVHDRACGRRVVPLP